MPKLINRNPKLGKLGQYAVVRYKGEVLYLKDQQGRNAKHDTPEALAAYNRLCYDLSRSPAEYLPPTGEAGITVRELAAAYLDHCKATKSKEDYRQIRMVVEDFVYPLYGGTDTLVTGFTPKSLKRVRENMVQSERFNRDWCNRYSRSIITMFRWGVEEELVPANIPLALKDVKPLPAKYPGTFEGKKRKPVPDDVLIRTLPYLSPTVQSMVKVQRLIGARPSEICNLTVGAVNQSGDTWEILLTEHKTKAYVGERVIKLRPEAREIIAPYLVGKKPDNAVFSPIQAMREWNAARRASRKTKITPSQAARNQQRAESPKSGVGEFYTAQSYYRVICRAVEKANKSGENIPHWFPYMNRHATATADAMESILKMAMERLGHTDTRMTENYAQVKNVLENMLALTQDNPFASPPSPDTPIPAR